MKVQNRRRLSGLLMGACLAFMSAAALPAVVWAQDAPYLNTKLTAKQRAADLVSRMTLEEKAGQIHNNAPAIPRLGIPAYEWWNEGLHGVARAGEATVFPQAIGMAATWDVPLIKSVADTTATEFRAKNLKARAPDGSTKRYEGLTVWSPNVNIFRDPRWGRGQETWGEDPYLTTRMGVAYIEGLQGPHPEHPKTIAAVKHYAVHSGPESDRHFEDVYPSAYDVTDTYLPAFYAAITEAKAQSIMCAYNAVDGYPACANPVYMQDILRRDWKFEGHVVSDCAAIADFHLETSHKWVATPEQAVAEALKADTDLICDFASNATAQPQTVINAVNQGLLPMADLDEALVRLFEARIRLGLYDAPGTGPWGHITQADYDTPEHRALSLQTSEASMVLLKNDGLLPLKSAPKRIAVIGPNADSVDALVGNYNGTPSQPVTIVAGLKARYPDAEVVYVEGTGWVAPPLEDVPDAAFCVDAACTQAGLKQEIFNNLNVEGSPVLSRDDTNIAVRWGFPEREARETTSRWSGYLKAGESGPYRFRYTGNSGYRIWIDDTLIADVWDTDWPTSDTEVRFDAGRTYAIRVESVQKGNIGMQRLQWSRPGAGGERALEVARSADLVVFAAGLTARLEGEEMRVNAPGFAGGDRTSLDLPAPQQAMLEALHATGKPVVLVMMNGSAMSVNWADEHIPAIIEAWYPGGEGGHAVARLIAGDFSPSGRLPITFPRSADDLPPFKDYSMKGRTYRYSTAEALYPFGYGLSYTTFAYGQPEAPTTVKAGERVELRVPVTNTGDREGAEVVQLYVTRDGDMMPVRALKGFQRVHLKPGETKLVSFTLDPAALSTVDQEGKRRVDAGTAKLWIGGGQPHQRAGLKPAAGVEATLSVTGSVQMAY